MGAGAAGTPLAARPAQGDVPDTGALRAAVEGRLDALLPESGAGPRRLHEAMRACVLSPGKRFRPCLTLLVAEHCEGNAAAALDAGCAVEMVHAASLVIDDLPAMDDAAMRRGRPSLHRIYGEATAVLAAIAVLNLAYATVAALPGVSPDARTTLLGLFADAIGPEGLAGGQEVDVNGAPGAAAADISDINRRKTGALFALAAQAGACCGRFDAARLSRLAAFGGSLGLAFQTLDDMLDAGARPTGKDRGQDEGKPTVVRTEGAHAARREVRVHVGEALRHIEAALGPAPAFHALARQIFGEHA